MTGAQTDPISTPEYVIAVGAILRLARQFFWPDEGQCSESMNRWFSMRSFAERLLLRRRLFLNPTELHEFRLLLEKLPQDADKDYLSALSYTEPQ